MNLPEHKDIERLLRSHGWLLDEMQAVSAGGAGEGRAMSFGIVDVELGVLEHCVQLTAVGVRKTPGQFPTRQLELLAGSAGVHIVRVDTRLTPGPEPRVTTARVVLAELPE